MPQYSGVWSLQQQMQALTSGQWATDPLFDYTTLLLQADNAANSAQNNTFLDSSTNAFAITRNGNTTQGTFSPFSLQPGAWANYFNGSSQLTVPNTNGPIQFGTGAFTIEFWIYPSDVSNRQAILATTSGSGTGPVVALSGSPAGAFGVGIYGSADTVNTGAGVIVTNKWQHIAVVRNSTASNDSFIYVDGILRATGTISTNFSTAYAVSIGQNGAGGEYFTGYLSNLRVVKGTAVYTTNFTPSPTPLTAITNTSLLTCQNNRFVDNSSNAFAVTVNGTPSVQAFSPFAPQFQYTASVTGGSGYFDGTTDYLTGPNASGGDFSTGSFTISCWFYPTTLSSGTDYGVLAYADASGWNGWQLLARGTTKDMKFEFLSGSAGVNTITGGTIVLNAWNYVVVTRSGSTVNLYVNSTTSAATATNSTAYGVSTSKVVVGSDRLSSSALFGYISNVKLVKQANTPSSIPTAPDTSTTNTSLLLNFTNAGILDGTMKNNLETVGGASVSTSVVKYGSGSMYFDGTGDYLVSKSSPLWAFGVGDYTIECWFYSGAIATRGHIVSNSQWQLFTFSSKIYFGNGTTDWLIGGTTLSNNTWYHVAVTRSGTSLKLFINGTQDASATNSTDLSATTNALIVGALDTSGTYALNGYIDDMRITKGIARYTQNFIPPSVALPRQ